MARKLTAKQLKYFGTKAQRAAVRRRKSKPKASSAPKRRRRKSKPKSLRQRAMKWAGKNKGKAIAGTLGLVGLGVAAHPRSRAAVSTTVAAIRS